MKMNQESSQAFKELERAVHAALETYSNVHRGSGHNSMVSTHLYEQAREIVLEYLGLDKMKFVVLFCTPRRAELLAGQLRPESYRSISSQEIGLPLGIRALAVDKKELPSGIPFQSGGGTARLVSPSWVVWAGIPDKFEAGTPAIINVIAFVKALKLIRQSGQETLRDPSAAKLTADEILYHDNLENLTGKDLLDQLRQILIGRDVIVPTTEGPKPFVNLDNGASTPTFEPVWNTVCQTLNQPDHVQKEIIKEVKSITAGVLGVSPAGYDFVFTSNTTEAINLVAESHNREPETDIEPVILNTLLEHNSNDLPWRTFGNMTLLRLKVDSEGFWDLKDLEALLSGYNQKSLYGKKRIRLVSISGASNVLGVFNNIHEVSKIVHHYGAHLMVDAAQMVAHRKVEMEKWGIDYLAFSAHKVYAPFGSGVLVVKKGLLNLGQAELEKIQLSGEENTAGIAALGKSLLLLQRIGFDLIQEEEHALVRLILKGMTQIKGLTVYGIKDQDSPRLAQKGGVFVFALKGIMPDRLARELAVRGGIGVRYGCHCAHLLIKHILKVPHALENLQGLLVRIFPGLKLPGLARVSLGIGNTENDVAILISTLEKITRQPRAAGPNVLKPGEINRQIKDFILASARRVYS